MSIKRIISMNNLIDRFQRFRGNENENNILLNCVYINCSFTFTHPIEKRALALLIRFHKVHSFEKNLQLGLKLEIYCWKGNLLINETELTFHI